MTIPPGRWRHQLPWLIVALALLLRLGFAASQGLSRPLPSGSDEVEYDAYAWSLAQGEGYRGMSPDVSDQHHLTAYRPPGPSLVYAAIYLVAGHRPAVVRVFNCLLSALACLLIIAVGRRTVGEGAGIGAAAVWAVWPTSIFLSGSLFSEQLALVALLALVWSALRFAEAPDGRGALLAGVILGANLLVHPSRLFLLPFVAIWVLVQFRTSWRALALATTIPLIAALMLVPWIVRNERVFHAFIPFSTMGGSVLLQGNNRIVATDPEYLGYNVWDTAIPEYRDSLVAPNNELERDRVAKRLATAWIATHRDRMLPMAIAKIRRGWTPFLQPHTAAIQRFGMLISWGPVLLLMLLAYLPLLWHFLRTRHPGWILHLVILHIVVINVMFFGYARYRYVVEPYCLLIAAAGVVWLVTRRRRAPAA